MKIEKLVDITTLRDDIHDQYLAENPAPAGTTPADHDAYAWVYANERHAAFAANGFGYYLRLVFDDQAGLPTILPPGT